MASASPTCASGSPRSTARAADSRWRSVARRAARVRRSRFRSIADELDLTPSTMPTALIAEDEPMLRAQLKARLAEAWPELEIVAEAAQRRRGAGARRASMRPDIAFLDIRMPVRSGLDVARELGGGCHVVFVTAYDEYAVAAFDEGAVDYVLKPPTPERIAKVVARLKARLAAGAARPHGAAREARGARRRRRTAQVDPRVARRVDADDRRRRRPLLPGRGQVHASRSPPTARR